MTTDRGVCKIKILEHMPYEISSRFLPTATKKKNYFSKGKGLREVIFQFLFSPLISIFYVMHAIT